VAYSRLWYSAIGAANPQDLRRLAFAQLDESIRVFLGRLLGINAVRSQYAVDGV
jgi:hypothetical protein